MEFIVTDEMKKKFINKFKTPVYSTYDWSRLLTVLKRKKKDYVINLINKALKKGYKNRTDYPYNGCDFASDFGYILLKDLGYNVKILQNFNDGEHNFLMVDDEVVDFTSVQFEKGLPIRNVDMTLKYYLNSQEHTLRMDKLDEIGYEGFVREAKRQTDTGLLNYIPFSTIIEMVLYNKK